MKKHLLFLCTANIDRSPTGEALFENSEKYESKSAGIYPLARKQVTKELVDWADYIFVMDERRERHKTELLKQFPELEQENKPIIILNISNEFVRHDPELERRMKISLEREGFL